MLRTDTWTYFDGFSELDDGTCVMRFYGRVNKADPSNILITEEEASEDSYRKNVDVIRQDRREFEDLIYAEADRISAELFPSSPTQEQSSEEINPELSDDLSTPEGGVLDEI